MSCTTNQLASRDFFNRDVQEVAKDLLGSILERYLVEDDVWLSARIIETEAYYGLGDRGSHASLGFTNKRKALFMDPGTIYMYFARGGDSLNFTCRGHRGDAVLIKSGYPANEDPKMLEKMRILNPSTSGSENVRPLNRLCNGQTLLCKSLGLKVREWDCAELNPEQFRLIISGEKVDHPSEIIQTTRLGIPRGRDEHLPYRFIHADYVTKCTKNPLTMRKKPTVTIIRR